VWHIATAPSPYPICLERGVHLLVCWLPKKEHSLILLLLVGVVGWLVVHQHQLLAAVHQRCSGHSEKELCWSVIATADKMRLVVCHG